MTDQADLTNEPPPSQPAMRTRVSIWGQPTRPRWSVLVTEASTDAEVDELIVRAVRGFRDVGHALRAQPERAEEPLVG